MGGNILQAQGQVPEYFKVQGGGNDGQIIMSCQSSFTSQPPTQMHWSSEISYSICLFLAHLPGTPSVGSVGPNGCCLSLYLSASPTSPPIVLRPHPDGLLSLLTAPALGLANVLVDDVTDAELLPLLHPQELHTLVDEYVLLLQQETKPCPRAGHAYTALGTHTPFWYHDSIEYYDLMSKETIFII